MKRIGIVGAGIAGLHLALYLQKQGVAATLYSDRTPAQIRAGRVPNMVVRFAHTRARERALGVDFWDFEDFGVYGVEMYVCGEPPLRWKGRVRQPASGVDMRLYQSALIEAFAARGGTVVVGPVAASDLPRLGRAHDLVVVAAGRGPLAERFPRLPERSPFAAPQRRLTGAFYHGIGYAEPLAVAYNISPGNGEIFQAPFHTVAGRVSSLLIEGIPGQAFDEIMEIRYDEAPRRFEERVLALLREHAPPLYERVDKKRFGVTRPEDVLQGAITPVVRKGYAALPGGSFAVAVGDMHVQNDPVLGQGANAASRCGWRLGELVVAAERFDRAFCEIAEQELWEAAQAATHWTNLMLQPPPPHVIQLLVAAGEIPAIADELVDNFNQPDDNWAIFRDAQGSAAFLQRHGWQPAPLPV